MGYNTIQLSLPLDLGAKIDPDDEVVSFLKALKGVNFKKYLKREERPSLPPCLLSLSYY